MPGDRGRYLAGGNASGARTGRAKAKTRAAASDPQRQWTRVREPRCRSVGLRTGPAVAYDSTRTTDGERLRGKFQWAFPRRVPERELVQHSCRRTRKDCSVEAGLQPDPTAFGTGLSNPGGVC